MIISAQYWWCAVRILILHLHTNLQVTRSKDILIWNSTGFIYFMRDFVNCLVDVGNPFHDSIDKSYEGFCKCVNGNIPSHGCYPRKNLRNVYQIHCWNRTFWRRTFVTSISLSCIFWQCCILAFGAKWCEFWAIYCFS